MYAFLNIYIYQSAIDISMFAHIVYEKAMCQNNWLICIC